MAAGSSRRRLGDCARSARRVFFETSEEEVKKEVSGTKMPDRNDDTKSDGGPSREDEVLAGERSEYWFERMEKITEKNRKKTLENKNLLTQVDYRTVWIARLLMGLLITLLGGILVQVLL